MEGHDRPGRGRLPEGHVGHRSGPAHNAHAPLPAASEAGDALDDVAAVGNLHDVGAQRVGTVAGDNDGRLRLILRPRRPPPRSPTHLAFPGASYDEVRAVVCAVVAALVIVVVVDSFSLLTFGEAAATCLLVF